jgi:hypothetical protein
VVPKELEPCGVCSGILEIDIIRTLILKKNVQFFSFNLSNFFVSDITLSELLGTHSVNPLMRPVNTQ